MNSKRFGARPMSSLGPALIETAVVLALFGLLIFITIAVLQEETQHQLITVMGTAA